MTFASLAQVGPHGLEEASRSSTSHRSTRWDGRSRHERRGSGDRRWPRRRWPAWRSRWCGSSMQKPPPPPCCCLAQFVLLSSSASRGARDFARPHRWPIGARGDQMFRVLQRLLLVQLFASNAQMHGFSCDPLTLFQNSYLGSQLRTSRRSRATDLTSSISSSVFLDFVCTACGLNRIKCSSIRTIVPALSEFFGRTDQQTLCDHESR